MPILSAIAAASAKSFGFTNALPTSIPTIGSSYEGGFFAGQISTAGNGVADYNLVVSPRSSGDDSKSYGNVATAGTDSVIDGPGNSSAMNSASHPAAQFCEGLTIGGFSDWYMPAKNELEVCYYNLKPTTLNNRTDSGTNTNAVPSRNSNYTTTVPARTSATNFYESTGAERFDSTTYWSSTSSSGTQAWRQYFGVAGYSGLQGVANKTNTFRVRAIRRVPV
jgi:hypothetical protein